MNTGFAILCYNKISLSQRCIQSVLDAGYALDCIHVIDNGSQPEFQKRLTHAFPGIRIIHLSENTGFAGGFKTGLSALFESHPEMDSLLFLTNDTQIHSNCLEACQETAKSTGAELVAPCLLFRDKSDRIDSIGARFDAESGNLQHLKSENLPQLLKQNEYIPGTALWLKRNAFDSLGGTDPSFVMYWEDVDFCFRAHQLGIFQARCYDARISHGVGQTCHKKPIYTTFYYQRNRIRFCKKWLTAEQLTRVLPMIRTDLETLEQRAAEKSDSTRLQYLEQLFEEL